MIVNDVIEEGLRDYQDNFGITISLDYEPTTTALWLRGFAEKICQAKDREWAERLAQHSCPQPVSSSE